MEDCDVCSPERKIKTTFEGFQGVQEQSALI